MIKVYKDIFVKDHTIYWPESYESVVEFLKNGTSEGEQSSSKSLYKLNVQVIVFAACVGLISGERKSIVKEKKKEIALSTFIENDLAIYLFLIPLLSRPKIINNKTDFEKNNFQPDLDQLRGESGEELSIEIFQEYCAAGLEILNDELLNSGSMNSPYIFIKDIINKFSINTGDSPKNNDGIKNIDIEIF
jgi:hypothetical protein